MDRARYRRVRLFALASVLTLIAAACGGDEGPIEGATCAEGGTALLSVSRVGPAEGWAVGWKCEAGHRRPFATRYNGEAWAPVRLPKPPGNDVELMSVSGTTPTSVWAVGTSQTASGTAPVVHRFDGRNWTIWATPEAHALYDVSAVGFDIAWTAGQAAEQVPKYRTDATGESFPFAGRWISQLWRRSSVKPVATEERALAVGVGAGDDVWVAGVKVVEGRELPWVELRRDTWRILPVEGEEAGGRIVDVDVRTPDDVWLAGSLGQEPLLLHWDGKGLQRIELPDSAAPGELTGVAFQGDDVWVVGFTPDDDALAYGYIDGEWVLPDMTDVAGRLTDVTTFKDGSVLAVGWRGTEKDPEPVRVMLVEP
jgi:hypothetical protein